MAFPSAQIIRVLRYIRKHIYQGNDSNYGRDRLMLLYALTWPTAWLDSQALRMHSEDYQRMLMDKLKQIHAHGDPARYRAYFPKYLLKCLQDHCHHHHETLYRELKHASYSIEHSLKKAMTLQANFVLNNPAHMLKSYDFKTAILVGLNLNSNR